MTYETEYSPNILNRTINQLRSIWLSVKRIYTGGQARLATLLFLGGADVVRRVCGALEYFNATVELIAEMNSPAIYHLVCRAHYAR